MLEPTPCLASADAVRVRGPHITDKLVTSGYASPRCWSAIPAEGKGMSSPEVFSFSPGSETTSMHNYLLALGGYFSLSLAALQVSGIWWSPQAIRYLGGPADLSVKEPALYAFLCVAFAMIVVLFGLYGLSGAGQIRRMPLLRTALITVTLIYLLRGLLVIPQIVVGMRHPGLLRFLIFSVISLAVGIVYGAGVVSLYRHGRPGEGEVDSYFPF